MKKLLSALFLLALCSSLAVANVPDPSKCSVTPDLNNGCLIAPGNLTGTTLSITVRNASNNPIPNANVSVVFNSAIRICANAVHTAVTNAAGQCTINLRGGGCINIATTGACVVIANGIQIKGYVKVKSPDNASHDTSVPSGTITVADLPFFADEFKGVAAPGCHDYTNDNQVSTSDLPLFGDSFKGGLNCTLQ